MQKRVKIFLSIILCLAFSIASLYGQNCSVSGHVSDQISHNSIFYATVTILTTDSDHTVISGDYTDNKGNFKVANLSTGQYLLRISLVGYKTHTQDIILTSENKKIELEEIALMPESKMLGEVSVVAEKPLYEMDGEKTYYNVAEDPTVQNGTAADALQNAPGVEVDIEGNITLRGVTSVEIWVNGKPSRMNEDALKEFIQQMPANTLERIEVITNPSARYSAQGTGGIINVVTRSKIKSNSFLSFGVSGNTKPEVRPWVSYVYSSDKLSLNFFLNCNYNVRENTTQYSSYTFDNDSLPSAREEGTSKNKSQDIRGGFYFNGHYEIDTLNSFGWWSGVHPGWSKNEGENYNFRQEFLINPDIYEYNEADKSNGNNIGAWGGFWYEHKFKNDERHLIDANIGFNTWNSNNTTNYTRDYTKQDYLDKTRKDLSYFKNFGINGQVNYTIPYHKNGQIEVGISGDYNRSVSLDQVDTIDKISDLYVIDSLRLKDVLNNETELCAYTTLQHSFGNFTMKFGLRGEIEWIDYNILNSPKDNVKRCEPALFPSVHLSYHTENMHNFTLSYTHRIQHPEHSQLSTFINYYEDSYSTGNPELEHTTTNSVEAGWTKFFRKFGSVSVNLYYKDNINEIGTLTDVSYNGYYHRYVTFTQPINSGHSYRTGGDFNVTFRHKGFLSIRLYGNLYYYHSTFQFRDDENPQTAENFNYSFRLNFWTKLWKVLEINLSANYRSESIVFFTTTKPGYSIDLGLRADVWKNHISLHINVNDIFNWNKTSTKNNNPYYTSTSTTQYNSRFISAGITFRFGKMELEHQASQGTEMPSQGH